MHGHENRVRAHEREPEMQLRQRFVHHAAEHLREPIIRCCEYSEDRRHAHNQMKVRDHEIALAQVDVQNVPCEEWSAESDSHKESHKSDATTHRTRKPNPPPND